MKKKALWVFVVVWGIACLWGSRGCLEQERMALLVGNKGSNFNCCNWEYVECNPTTGRVTELMPYYVGSKSWYLKASLLLPFEELKSLYLSGNCLGRWIPPKEPNLLSSKLSKLEVLDLSVNSLDNSILPVLSTILTLKHLFLNNNYFSIKNMSHLENLYLGGVHLKDVATVLRAIGALSSLRILSLQGITIEGTITAQGYLAPLTSLKLLSSSNSDLSGNLSDHSLCNLVKLEQLDLSRNRITGRLPTCWRNTIRILNLEDNEFMDSLTSSPIASLASLEFLSITGNHFDIPSSLSPLADHSRLKVLFLGDNNLIIDTKVASSIPRLQLKVFRMSNSLSKGFKVTSLSFLNHQYDMRIMDLSSNDIRGPFPAWLLENNTKLEMLFLADNLFTTLEVPSRTLFNLRVMDISNNGMRGELTTKFCANVPNLDHLNLSANGLEGNIPSNLGSIKSLYFLDLSSNNFSGGLPVQLLHSNSSLHSLNVAYNNLQGQIVLPTDTMCPNLSDLLLDHNRFTGNLSFLSSYVNLRVFGISNNFFIGKLPRLIANMSNLVALDLSENQLDGVIPQEFCNLGLLNYLDLSYNNLSGPLPSFFISKLVTHIHLNRNKLNGTLAHVLSNSSYLVTLDLSENEFSGSIPHWLGNLSQLSILSLRGNSFDGTFPKQLCSLKSLSMIDLSENNLFGPLPRCLGPMNFSDEFADKVNSIPHIEAGFIPWSPWSYVRAIKSHTILDRNEVLEEIWQLPHTVGFTTKRRFDFYKGYALLKMVGLDFSCNQFSGEIPPEIAILQDMLVLNLSHNNLTGQIPTSLSSLTKIESIDLSYNNLTGPIPEELTQLNYLAVFNVSYNNLSGAIPSKYQFGAFDESSYYENHLLCGLPLSNDCSTTININCSATKSCAKAKEDAFIDGETFYVSFGVSYTTVLLVIPVVLFINPQWRQGWFHYVELVISTCQSSFVTCYYYVQDSFRKLSNC
ncbi:hypothetical protein BT93_D1817 [Corymbia citriodora subsp. variegata]|nr:hypothetical protein BT93_D1817 [Corymbia citriodora subsp. variegata]